MNKLTIAEFNKDCNSAEDRRYKYSNKLSLIYNDFSKKMKTWNAFEAAKDRILSHSLTYDDPEALEIQVAFYQIALYSNLITQSYIKNQYSKLGIDNFFSNISDIVGPIQFFTLEELNANKAYIIDNAETIISSTNSLYQKLSSYVAIDSALYVARIEWFMSVCTIVQSIIFTIEYALRSYLCDNQDDADEFMKKINNATGLVFNEVPTETSTLGGDN